MSHLQVRLLSILLAALLAACGGGGDDPPPPNAAPRAIAGPDQSVPEGAGVTLSGAGSSDPDGRIDQYRWEQTAGRAVALAGAASVDASFTAPATTEPFTLGFRLTVTDDAGARGSDEVQVTVTPVNVAPVAVDDTADTAEDTAVVIDVLANDHDPDDDAAEDDPPELDAASVAVSDVTGGAAAVDPASGGVQFQPAPNFSGSAGFRYTVADRHGAVSDAATVTVTVRPVNDPPQAFDDGAETDEDSVAVVDVLANDVDADGALNPASVTIRSETHGVATVNPQTGAVSFLPDANFFGEAFFTYTVADVEGGVSNVATVIVVVNPVNDRPVAQGASFGMDEDTVLTGRLAASDVDDDPASLTFAKAGDPASGALTLETDGAFRYTPSANFAGSDSFTFTASDRGLTSAAATVSVTVADRPEAGLAIDSAGAGEADGSLRFVVRVSRTPDTEVTVSYATADGTAVAGKDYTSASGTLSFDGSANEQVISVPVTDDPHQENEEELGVTLTVTGGAASVNVANASAVGTITDDDDKGLLRIGAARRSVTPAQAHIDGLVEPRLGGAPRVQKFNLGGFGVNPLQNLPDDPGPVRAMQQVGEALTRPAGQRVFTGGRGPEHTHVRAMVLEQADGVRVAFVMLDAVGAGNIIQNRLKQEVNDAACAAGACFAPPGTAPEQIGNIVFGQTHTHAGADLQGLWGGVPQDWLETILYPQAVAAVSEAIVTLQPARLMLRQGQDVEFNNYRRPRYDFDADADGTLTLLRAVADDGAPIGSILQYNAHPTGIGSSTNPRTPHADYIQGAMDWLENAQTGPGGVALYYNGPIADASGSGSRAGCTAPGAEQPYSGVRCRGEGIADSAQKFPERELAPSLAARHVEVTLPITNAGFLALGLTGTFNRYYDFLMLPVSAIPGLSETMTDLPQVTPAARTLVSRVTIGGVESGLEVVTIPGEATNTFGQYIRGLTDNPSMMLLGLTQNSFGYILPEEEFNYVDPGVECARATQEPFCNSGLVAPFTGYEENVSLGPLTAPLLRAQGYNRLFDRPREEDLPPVVSNCVENPLSPGCLLNNLGQRVDYIQRSLAEACRDPDDRSNTNDGLPEPLCALIDPETPWHSVCVELGLPEDVCRVFGTGAPDSPTEFDTALSAAAADAAARGCDLLDPSHCLFPFPNDHFTVAASAGSPQSAEKGGTGKRINFNPLAMPRNVLGRPIDPTEWNRNDGYSPGQMIVTYVPGLTANADGTIPGAPTIKDPRLSLKVADSPVLVLDAQTGEPHPVWAEIDLNAGKLLVNGGEAGGDNANVDNPKPKRPALIIRPAVNFEEGRRYVVVLRNLRDARGNVIPAGPAFTACRDRKASNLPPVAQRCAALEQNVFGALPAPMRNPNLYLAWDFTVASTGNNIGRLRHMRDDAFVNYLGQVEDAAGNITDLGRAPAFDIHEVNEHANHNELVREIKGTFRIPSYVVPADPSPLDGNAQYRQLLNQLPPNAAALRSALSNETALEVSAPPNRLHYLPDATGASACDPNQPQASLTGRCLEQARFGDGLPDRSGEMSSTFTCRIAKRTLNNKSFAQATPADVTPARAGIYGHGLLGTHSEINQNQLRRLGNDHNFLFCATDWFGFASGDLANVATLTVDISNFPVLPDGTQQGILNQMFLARLLRHPDGFASHAAFQVQGKPVFDNREVFYDGNSQGGITGGVVVALSKDIRRGVLGVPGMNYSTLLARSVDFDTFSVPLYLAYPDDLDRNFIFSMMQMLWDRSENNGYAHHMTDNRALKGAAKEILLHPAYGDHQVTMWSADVMARTIGATVDRSQVSAGRKAASGFDHPELPGFEAIDYANPAHAAGSLLMYWDQPWPARYEDADHCFGKSTPPPPIGNVPPRVGDDPHECPRRQVPSRCQKSHFLHPRGRLVDVSTVVTPFDCPAVTPLDDLDGDGVPNAADRCGFTPAGAPVDANGCAASEAGADEDGDGVANAGDACAGTAAGEPADGNGCSASQRDSDGDGVNDAADLCPGTPAGEAADGAGCSASQRPAADAGYGGGLIGALAQFVADLHGVLTALLAGSAAGVVDALETALGNLAGNLGDLGDDAGAPDTFIGLDRPVDEYVERARSAERRVEPVVLTGAQLPGWSQPAAFGIARPYPSGAGPFYDTPDQACGELPNTAAPFPTGPLPNNLRAFCTTFLAAHLNQHVPYGEDVWTDPVRSAHNGIFLYPTGWRHGDAPVSNGGVPVGQIAAFRYDPVQPGGFVEIPVQVDERFPHFLANGNSGFSFYSGTDEELSYAWDVERWNPGDSADGCSVAAPAGSPDPVAGLDHDDEVVFMASDAGTERAPAGLAPAGLHGADAQEIVLADPLDPAAARYAYLFLRSGGSSFGGAHYVRYQRDANADQWIDKDFFASNDPEKLGTSNRGYGPNLSGTVCQDGVRRHSADRFPRDGVTVATDTYRWRATGRWMVRDLRVKDPAFQGVPDEAYWATRGDLVDRWKGRAFQQSPDSNISLVGFEDEQVNWEANSTLLGERIGPVRAIREVWGADSGTNVTKIETFYRDAVTYRFRVRVHPIPPDGLYMAWDYNRGAMVPSAEEAAAGVPGGRFYTVLRPQGVPIDGVNDEIGNVDGTPPIPFLGCPSPDDGDFVDPAGNGLCPAYFDFADPTFNLPLSIYNWEQVSGKGDLGSLVYLFENKSETSFANPLVIPYYRDDACLDDGTGDDPVARPFPGDEYDWGSTPCTERQGAHASHGLHFLVTHDTDNLVLPKPYNEIDGQQWQFAVPTAAPANIAEPYANVVRAPLRPVTVPRPGNRDGPASFLGHCRANSPSAEFCDRFEQVTGAFVDECARQGEGFGFGDEAPAFCRALFQGDLDAMAGFCGQVAGGSPFEAFCIPFQALADGLASGKPGRPPPVPDGVAKAGVAVVDATWHVGAGAGQHGAKGNPAQGVALQEGFDPNAHSKTNVPSYGVQSRLTARAIVLEGTHGRRIALVKTDNYLAQDYLLRRVGQLLEHGDSGVGYEDILHAASHNHSSPYNTTPSWGVWVFTDAMDLRMFEYQARALANAIERAADDLRPAKMGATTVQHRLFKGNVTRPQLAQDGTPAGYPREYGDLGLVVVRFDDAVTGRPIAAWMNWGQHPEGLDGYDLITADYLGPLERFVEREIGAPLVFAQGDVGSAENTGNAGEKIDSEGNVRDWYHKGFAQTERGARLLADSVVQAWHAIGAGNAQVPFTTDFKTDRRSEWVPGPLSHPYPSISNCNTEETAAGNPGSPILGLPDCRRAGRPPANPVSDALRAAETMLRAHGAPVPSQYDAPSYAAVEENNRLRLQAFRVGDVLLGSCACESQVDLILNFESRADDQAGNIYDGFDWSCGISALRDPVRCAEQDRYFDQHPLLAGQPIFDGDKYREMRGSLVAGSPQLARMLAQVHNDAAGWDAPENAPFANSEPAPPQGQPTNYGAVKGNFTREEIQARGAPGYKLPVGIGHAGDYNGYTVSYREYMAYDHYRKALTAYGPHTADYMVTRLVRMAAEMQDGGMPYEGEPHDVGLLADELRQQAMARSLGATAAAAYDAWRLALPDDVGPAAPVAQPQDIERFSAATFKWRGGSNAVDNPVARVERFVDGAWAPYADHSGEVQTFVFYPAGVTGVADAGTGSHEWIWLANFEAFTASPRRIGQTPVGTYRFVVSGRIRQRGRDLPYEIASQGFEVRRWSGVGIADLRVEADGSVSFAAPEIHYPRTYASEITNLVSTGIGLPEFEGNAAMISDDGGNPICETCTFRPWARRSTLGAATVTVQRAGGAVQQIAAAPGAGGRWFAPAALAAGDAAFVAPGGLADADAETNGAFFAFTPPALSVADAAVVEGPAGVNATMTFTARLSFPKGVPVTVNYATADGTATQGQDYVGIAAGSVEIPADRDRATFTVTVIGDSAVEAHETFGVSYGSPGAAGAGVATGTILDDDAEPPPPEPAAAGAPGYADVCDAYGVPGSDPLCGGLRQAETEVRASCEATHGDAPDSFCTLSGGNLHALIDTCYDAPGGSAVHRRDAGPLAVCRIVDAFVTAAAAYCRQVSAASQGLQRPQLCALMGGQHVGEYEMQAFERHWVHKALRLQNRLGYGLPLIHTSVVATHNSYNATDENTPPTLSGSDANQLYGIVDQLRMGVRSLEIDVHWMPRRSAGAGTHLREPVVCHATTFHAGCTLEKPLRDVLREMRTWLDANPNEIVLIYVEDNLSEPGDSEDAALSGHPYESGGRIFDDVLGDIVWKPADTTPGSSCQDTGGVFGQPRSWLNLKRGDIVAAGKQVLLTADGCSAKNKAGAPGPTWDAVMHWKNTGNNVRQDGSYAGGVDYEAGRCVYARADYERSFVRVWEDHTMVTASDAGDTVGSLLAAFEERDPSDVRPPNASDNKDRLVPAVARELMRCGMHMPGLDSLAPFDGRLEAMVWSWAPNEPAADSGSNGCAYHNAAGRLVAGDCDVQRAHACVSDGDPNTWTLAGFGTASAAACPAGARFSVPHNGYGNEKLKEAKAAAGVSEVWVHYRRDPDAFEGWGSNHDATGAGRPRGSAAAVAGQGLLGALGRFFHSLGQAVLAFFTGDFGGAQTHLAAALEHLASGSQDGSESFVAQTGAALEDATGRTADDPADAPDAFADAGETVVAGGGALIGTSHVLPPAEEGACTPDNTGWESFTAYLGALHEHSGYSDGTPGTQPRDYFAQGVARGLDFMGSAEHSDNADVPMTLTERCVQTADSFVKCPVADDDNPVDALRKWDATLEQARAASTPGFTAFRGFEWTSDRFGHINVFFSRHDWNAKTTEGYAVSMESFWEWFTARAEAGGGHDGLAVFNHPGREDELHKRGVPDPAYAFNGFEYRPEADLRMVGIEMYGKSGNANPLVRDGDAYDLDNNAPAGGWYALALDRGWHVGPVGAEDEHGTSWGAGNFAKTVLIARDRSEGALREALFARRFYALSHHHNDLRLSFTGAGLPMGARIARAPGGTVQLDGSVTGADVGRVEIVTNGGTVAAAAAGNSISHTVTAEAGERWYFLRVRRINDDRPIAYSAPVWVRAGGAYPVCGEWLAGDLHAHTTYSHDSWGGPDDDEPVILDPADPPSSEPQEIYTLGHTTERQFAIASARGLDYLAITDHNDIQSQADPGFGAHGVIPIPSYENSLKGHAQMHGARKIYDNGDEERAAVEALAEALRDDGGVFQVNHPAGESTDFPVDADWRYARNGYDLDIVPDAVEVWNIQWLWQPPLPSSNSIDDAVRYWEGWLDRGARVAATGGSDNHYVATTPIQGAGQPTTWVLATERSTRGVLEGLRAARTFISHQPPLLAGPTLHLEGDADGDGTYEARVGGSVPSRAGLRVRATGAAGAFIRVVSDGGTLLHGPIPAVTPVAEFRFDAPAGAAWVRAELVEPDAAPERATVCDGAVGGATTYCRNRLAVLGMTSALYLE